MAGKTHYTSKLVLRALLRGQSFTPPSALYLAAFTGITDGDAGTVTEVSTSGTNYSRVRIYRSVDEGTPYFSDPTTNSSVVVGDVDFPTASADWPQIVAAGLYDAPTGGNLLYVDTLAEPKTIYAGQHLHFEDGEIEFIED